MTSVSKVAILGDLSAEDDWLHNVQADQTFSESNLFYYAGRTASGKNVGGIIRVANRPNQGYAEATVLYFAGDGSAFFKFERPEISGNTSWTVSNWNLEVLEAGGVKFRSRYDGDAFHLCDPHMLANPKLAFKQPSRALALDLTHYGKSPMVEFRYQRDSLDEGMDAIAQTKGLHQLTRLEGSIEIAGEGPEAIDGFGWRDHNWGPRNWQAFPKHEFYTGNFDQDRGFVLFKTEGGLGYFMHEGPGILHEVTELDIDTSYEEDGREPQAMRAKVGLSNGATHVIEGRKIDFIPLRNRRDGMTTHLGYSLWKYELDGSFKGTGIAEHMSQSKDDEAEQAIVP